MFAVTAISPPPTVTASFNCDYRLALTAKRQNCENNARADRASWAKDAIWYNWVNPDRANTQMARSSQSGKPGNLGSCLATIGGFHFV